jgi:predicted Na+-dependent transporter
LGRLGELVLVGNVGDFLGIALGVLVAVIYPVLKGYIQKEFVTTGAPGVPPWIRKYGALFLFCLVTALIVLAGFRAVKPDVQISFWVALLMGFGYEASVEKVFAKPI